MLPDLIYLPLVCVNKHLHLPSQIVTALTSSLQGVALTEPGVLFVPAPSQAEISVGPRGTLAQTAGNSIMLRYALCVPSPCASTCTLTITGMQNTVHPAHKWAHSWP